jgi:flagellar export protein FliJ
MPPKFSLQPVLDYRHNLVEALEIELGSLLNTKMESQRTLEALEKSASRLNHALYKEQTGDMDLFTITQIRANIQATRRHILKQLELLAVLEQQIEAKRLELVEAKQDEEALDTLRVKELEKHKLELNQQELRLQDDIYVAQAFRRLQKATPEL